MKKLFVLVLLFISVFASGQQITRLRVLNYLEPYPPSAASVFNRWISEFERINPDVRIDIDNAYDEAYHIRFRSYVASGNIPDIVYAWPTARMDYAYSPRRVFKNLLPLMEREGLRSAYVPFTFNPSLQPGGFVDVFTQGITTTHVFYINMEVLNACGLQPARTYEELKAQVPVLRARGYETIILPALFNDWVHNSCIFSMILGRFCGADWYQRITNGSARYTDSDFVAAFNFYRQIFEDGVIDRSNLVQYSDGPGIFAGNISAYYIDGDWRVGGFITDPSTRRALITPSRQRNIILGNFPEIPGARMNNSNSAIIGTGWAMAASIPAGSAREDAAWRFIKFMVSKEVQELRVLRGAVPTPSNTNIDFNVT